MWAWLFYGTRSTHPGSRPFLQAYVKERIEHTKSDKEKDALKNELIRMKKQVAVAEASMKNFEAEVCSLWHTRHFHAWPAHVTRPHHGDMCVS